VRDAIARAAAATVVLAVMLASSCASQQDTIQQQQEQLESLGATTQALGEAWLAGNLSGTYTRTALEQAFAQVEQARTALAARPRTLLDPRAARLSQGAEQLSRVIAAMVHDVDGADADRVRAHLAAIPILPEGS
jgi:hypothetical protein